MWYSVNYYKLVFDFLFSELRRPTLLAFLYANVRPLVSLHNLWKTYRASNIYKLEHNGQVCRLRKALNDAFDMDLRRIYIDGTGGEAMRTYIYTPAENQTKYLGAIYLYNSLEFVDTGADFLVYVPGSIVASLPFELRAMIDFYKLGGKRYLIIEIEG